MDFGAIDMPKTHGMSGTKTHKAWKGMFLRCRCKSYQGYARYGGRGITVCERWSKFENFFADMGECDDGMTLDRIDSDGRTGLRRRETEVVQFSFNAKARVFRLPRLPNVRVFPLARCIREFIAE